MLLSVLLNVLLAGEEALPEDPQDTDLPTSATFILRICAFSTSHVAS